MAKVTHSSVSSPIFEDGREERDSGSTLSKPRSSGRKVVKLAGKCPAGPALKGGVKGHNIKEVPYREATPFRA